MLPRDRDLDREIGARVAEFRQKHGMTQVDLGRLLGRVSPSSPHKYETGKAGLTLGDLIKIAEHFDISLDRLIRNVDPKGVEPALDDAQIDAVLTQLAATPDERAVFASHRYIYTHQRITAAYVLAFLFGRRSNASVEQAVDAAVLATAREAAIAETGSAERAKADTLRKKRKKRRR